MANPTPKIVHSLIIDAGPIIKNEPSISTLIAQAEGIYTIPAVIEEIRDADTRARVQTTLLPFLTLRSPKPASIKIIADFARKTGDLEVLSRPDIHLMALAYELECERNHGDWRLRSVPGQKRLNGAPPEIKPEELSEDEQKTTDKNTTLLEISKAPVPETRGAWGTSIPPPEPVPASDEVVATIEKKMNETHIAADTPDCSTPSAGYIESQDHPETSFSTEPLKESEPEDSDSEGWITPSNLKKHQQKDANLQGQQEESIKTMQVATITSDFAMQNVLLRMNLNLLSPSLQRIRQLKTWVLRCHACFFITKDMTKQFCTRCGKPTLMRTSCSTDKDGNFQVHLKKNLQWNTRGNVYSVPKPVAGTSNGKIVSGGGKGGWGQTLILAEDQKEYVKAMTSANRRKEKDLMDEDYLPNILSGDRRADGRPRVGAGKSVNSRKKK